MFLPRLPPSSPASASSIAFSHGRAPRRGEAIVWSAGWLLVAVTVAAGMALAGGPGGEWTTVYLIERSLSLDNVFLFSLLLTYFLVPPALRGRVILIGIAGALLLRGVAIAAGLALIESVGAVVYLFGVLLIYVAYRTFRGGTEETDPAANPILRLVRRTVPITTEFRGRRLFVREEDRLYGTPLLLVVVAIVVADIAFAVDSIPAAFAITHDPVVIWTANAFALLGLGALLALVDILVRRFRYLGKTIALILAFVGIKIHRRPRPRQRPRLARRHRRSSRRRRHGVTRRRSPRPAPSRRSSGATPAPLSPQLTPQSARMRASRPERRPAADPGRRADRKSRQLERPEHPGPAAAGAPIAGRHAGAGHSRSGGRGRRRCAARLERRTGRRDDGGEEPRVMNFVLFMLVREMRASWRRLLLFFVCIAVGVGPSSRFARSFRASVRPLPAKPARS